MRIGDRNTAMDVEGLPQTGFVASSPLPLIVISLPDERVQMANPAAAEFFGMSTSELLGHNLNELLDPTDSGKAVEALSALMSGSIEAYRSRGTYVGRHGPMDASIWVRGIPRRTGSMALVLILPANYEGQFAPSSRAAMGPLAVDLALGTTDEAGRIVTVQRSNLKVLGKHRDRSGQNSYLSSQVHPDDQLFLRTAFRQFKDDPHDVVLALRVSHEELGWVTAQCHLFATGDDRLGEPIGFVLTEATKGTSTRGRIAQLEQHLARIASEAQAAGLTARSMNPEDERAPTDLSLLTPRQRDIVNRLLDGARVPSIAASLFISTSTVRNHLSGVYRTLGVHSQAALIELLRPAN
jgi:PAS domain S-box-containing protein